MTYGLIAIGVGIALCGYFVGEGLKNFRNPSASSDYYDSMEDWGQPKLIKQSEVHYHLGIKKEDAKSLVQDYPSVPHVKINNQIYYPTKKLKQWAETLSKEEEK